MIESKIYAQISDFINTNYRTKIYIHIFLLYLWEIKGNLAFR